MAGERFVLLGLARPRAEWFRVVGQWATAAAIPAEFLRCVSVEELRARLGAGRPYSAVLVDGALPAVDRDVVDLARQSGCAVVAVDDRDRAEAWHELGAAAVLAPGFSREVLLDTLATHARLVGRGAVVAPGEGADELDVAAWRGEVATVCGPGGTGASTVAAALAQGLAKGADHPGAVVLADLALNAEQAMLHDVRDVVPGVQELVEAHRARRLGSREVQALTFTVVERGYHLLLGLRKARYWTTLRPRSFEAAFESLRRAFATVVCDVSADFEGEHDGGSADVAERNHMARTAAQAADVVFAVGRPGVKGLHALVRVLADLAALGVPAGRIVPVFNTAPRSPRARAELAATLARLAVPAMGGGQGASPLFLPTRKVEEALRDAVALPTPLPGTLAGAFRAAAARVGGAVDAREPEPELVVPGSLGLWSGTEAAT